MWVWLRRWLWALGAATFMYAVFFPKVGGKTLAQHLRDVWNSAIVQEKVGVISRDVRAAAGHHLSKLTSAGQLAPPTTNDAAPEVDAADRRALNELVDRLSNAASNPADAPE